MKDIVILANFCGIGKNNNDRFRELAEKLSMSEAVEVITSSFSHSAKKAKEKVNDNIKYRYCEIYEPGYPKNICLKRFWSHFVWGRNVKRYLANRKKPDVIYCAVPSLTGPLAAARYCEKNGIKLIIDVQDLWPEAFQMVFDVPVLSDVIFFPFKAMANGIYRRADEVCAVSETYVERALSVNTKCTNGHCVFLGTRLEDFDRYVEENPVTDKPTEELWLGYCGTLGSSYDLPCVFDAMALLRERGVELPKFIVMGGGSRREEFEMYARQKELNVEFTGNLPYPEMCGKLSACDMVINPIMGGSAGSIINKHADYAASGLPVINTQESPEYRDLVDTYHMGFNCRNSDSTDVADKLEVLIKDEALRKEMGANARRCAAEKFDRQMSYTELISCILK